MFVALRFALLLLCACNQIFGLRETRASDAQFFDAPVDSAFSCPQDLSPPRFTKLLHQAVEQNCYNYNISVGKGFATALCIADSQTLSQGAIDGAMAPIALTSSYKPTQFKLAPEGDRAYALIMSPPTGAPLLARFDAAPDGSWKDGAVQKLPLAISPPDMISTPSGGPVRRMIYVSANDATWHELVESTPDVWTEARATPYKYSDLGAVIAVDAQLSADGLRVVAYGALTGDTDSGTLYSSRASTADDLGQISRIATVPAGVEYEFLSEDCGRMYFSAIDSVFYVQRE